MKVFRCEECNFTAQSEKVLKEHNHKTHEKEDMDIEKVNHVKEFWCDKCNCIAEGEIVLTEHKHKKHEEEDIEEKTSDSSVQNDDPANNVGLKTKVIRLEERIKKILSEHEIVVANLTTNFENSRKDMKQKLDKLNKNDIKQKAEIKNLKDENKKIAKDIGQFQYDKDKAEAEAKSKEKISKIKENTKLFNRIIEKHLDDGIIKNVDIEKYKDK